MSLSKFDPNTATLIAGQTMIEANAGTGKTYTLCRIVERLIIEKKIPIERILAVTFTNASTAPDAVGAFVCSQGRIEPEMRSGKMPYLNSFTTVVLLRAK